MIEWTAALLVLLGSTFTLLAAIGVVRLPDIYLRLQAATKATTFGVCSIVLAAALQFSSLGETARSLLIIVFMLFTAPVSAHLIARAAYAAGVPLWEDSHVDELGAASEPGEASRGADA